LNSILYHFFVIQYCIKDFGIKSNSKIYLEA
jgi:hypothetical protein